jgi:hypothetical protein
MLPVMKASSFEISVHNTNPCRKCGGHSCTEVYTVARSSVFAADHFATNGLYSFSTAPDTCDRSDQLTY